MWYVKNMLLTKDSISLKNVQLKKVEKIVKFIL